MSSPNTTLFFTVFLLLTTHITQATTNPVILLGRRGRMVGGRSEVKDVERNMEVQRLGRFAVKDYNRSLSGEKEMLGFVRVVEAQRQVVSGLKYYLKVLVDSGGRFEAVVVVKPWENSRELVSFTPCKS